MKYSQLIAISLASTLLVGCASRVPLNTPPKVEQRGSQDGVKAKRPDLYTVVRGDSLSAIAQRYELSVADIQRWNGLGSSISLQAGQVLKLTGTPTSVAAPSAPVVPPAAPDSGATTGSVKTGPIEAKPLPESKAPVSPAAPATPVATVPSPPSEVKLAVVTSPRGMKRPYSDALLAEMTGQPLEVAKLEPPKGGYWSWPSAGKVAQEFVLPNQKGLLINGKLGDAVNAAHDGTVIFSGEGPRGFGNLVIVKHANDIVSVYGNNKAVLVKEGQAIKKGQKVAEMGSSGNGKTQLIFEVRQAGKPTDPGKFLPPRPAS
jgi:lipoprotein NlpD